MHFEKQTSNFKAFSFWLVTAQYLIMYLSKTWLFISKTGRVIADLKKKKTTNFPLHPVHNTAEHSKRHLMRSHKRVEELLIQLQPATVPLEKQLNRVYHAIKDALQRKERRKGKKWKRTLRQTRRSKNVLLLLLLLLLLLFLLF